MSTPTTNSQLVGIRNDGPNYAENVVISVNSYDKLSCDIFGPGLNLAPTQDPSNSSITPFKCEYTFKTFYKGSYFYVYVDHPDKNSYIYVEITGKDISVKEINVLGKQ